MSPFRTWISMVALAALLLAGPALAQDADADGTPDQFDRCSEDPQVPIPCGLDADGDGYGNRCDPDFNNDGVVNAADAAVFIADDSTGMDGGTGTDMNCDGIVASTDAGLFLGFLNGAGVPGPSGLPCAGTVPCP